MTFLHKNVVTCWEYFFSYVLSDISFNAPSLQHVLGFSYYISNSAMIEKNKVKIWTPSPPRVALNYWITLNKYLLCKITHLSTFPTFPTNHTHVITFFPLKTARREETDNVGKHSDSRRIPHRGLSKVNIYLWYLRRTHARINWPRFWTIWMSLDSFPPLRVKIHNVCYALFNNVMLGHSINYVSMKVPCITMF